MRMDCYVYLERMFLKTESAITLIPRSFHGGVFGGFFLSMRIEISWLIQILSGSGCHFQRTCAGLLPDISDS